MHLAESMTGISDRQPPVSNSSELPGTGDGGSQLVLVGAPGVDVADVPLGLLSAVLIRSGPPRRRE